jgi:Flp pilus assembly protein TadG
VKGLVRFSKYIPVRDSQGQSLVETALMVPLMLIVVLNALNLGYFFFVTVNLAAATRTGAEYAMLGPGSPGTTNYPPANTGSMPVTALIYQDLTGAVWNAGNATIQVCSPSVIVGGTGTSGTPVRTNCVKCTSSATCSSATGTTGASATFVPSSDPEAAFVLNRVDVQYSFPPLIPGSPFNLILIGNLYNTGTGQYTFYRHIEMRAM